jgi:hypothetical protein
MVLGIVLWCPVDGWAQPVPESSSQAPEAAPPATWSFSASLYTYVLPDEKNFAQPTFTADRSALHLEARYNYEDLKTGSAWVGYNFAGGTRLAWEITPVLGAVFGNTTGVAPGYELSLSWGKLGFDSDGEYVFSTVEFDESFLYNWSELTFSPAEWIRAGLATQRTRVYHTGRDIQRGLLVAATYKGLDVAAYVFNPDESEPIVIVSVTLNW